MWNVAIFLFVSLGIRSYSQLMIGVSNHLLSIVFRFHYHSQKVIGSLGFVFVFLFFWGAMFDGVFLFFSFFVVGGGGGGE